LPLHGGTRHLHRRGGQQQLYRHRRPRGLQRLAHARGHRSEEHTSELQSPCNLVCRLLLEKKKKKTKNDSRIIKFPHTSKSIPRPHDFRTRFIKLACFYCPCIVSYSIAFSVTCSTILRIYS